MWPAQPTLPDGVYVVLAEVEVPTEPKPDVWVCLHQSDEALGPVKEPNTEATGQVTATEFVSYLAQLAAKVSGSRCDTLASAEGCAGHQRTSISGLTGATSSASFKQPLKTSHEDLSGHCPPTENALDTVAVSRQTRLAALFPAPAAHNRTVCTEHLTITVRPVLTHLPTIPNHCHHRRHLHT